MIKDNTKPWVLSQDPCSLAAFCDLRFHVSEMEIITSLRVDWVFCGERDFDSVNIDRTLECDPRRKHKLLGKLMRTFSLSRMSPQ